MDRISCSYCVLKFKNSGQLKDHFKLDHQINISAPISQKIVCKTNKCFKAFTQIRGLLKHIDVMHTLDEEDMEISDSEGIGNSEKSTWAPKPLPFESNMAQLVSHLRFSSTVTGADMGRFVQSVDNLLSNVMTEVTDRVTNSLQYKNIDINNEEGKDLLDQLKYNESFSEYTNLKGQIKALQKNYHYIEAQDILLGTRPI